MDAKRYHEIIRVQVSKRLPKKAIRSIVKDLANQQLTFAISQKDSEYEVWREILPGDQPRVKNRKDGMTLAGIIEIDEKDLQERNFICIWEHGRLVAGNFDHKK
ncbi:MAG: hypothetical protein ACOX5R_08740 [bacterium]|jgi:hypothetical protein